MAVAAQEKCATTSFATPPASNTMMLAYPGDGTPAGLGTYGTVGATGRATGIRDATGFTGTTENWRTTSATAYDGAGWVTDSVDVTGQQTLSPGEVTDMNWDKN